MLSYQSLPWRNIRYFWVANIPIIMGVALGAAVLAGALIVGDSLRGSLRDRVERQLNGVTSAWMSNRLIQTTTAETIPNSAPALLLQGTASMNPKDGEPSNVPHLTIWGFTNAGIDQLKLPKFTDTRQTPIILSANVAKQLQAKVGDTVRLSAELFSNIPRSSLLGERNNDSTLSAINVDVVSVLSSDHAANDFTITPQPGAPLNVFLPLEPLQDAFLISADDRRALRTKRQELESRIRRVNTILGFGLATDEGSQKLAEKLELADWGLKIRTQRDRQSGKKVAGRELPYLSLESSQLLLDSATVDAAQATANQFGVRAEPSLTYLANDIRHGQQAIPYSIIAALNVQAKAPLGPFLDPKSNPLADDEILLAAWPESPIKNLPIGDEIAITYFEPEIESGAVERTASFKYRGTVPLEGVGADPSLTPPFPGITDRLSMGEWNPPFPYDNTRIKTNDIHDEFWQDYRTTPKGYITLAAGQKLFGSRFGNATSMRIALLPGNTPAEFAEQFEKVLLSKLPAKDAGFQFENQLGKMLAASQGGTDFGAMLLAFSFVLILSALLLVGLLFRLSVDRRAKEVGLLLAVGYSPKQIRVMLITEGMILAMIGIFGGLFAAVAYAEGMIRILGELWPDSQAQELLQLHVQPLSLIIGAVMTLMVAYFTIRFSLSGLSQVQPPQLLRGQTQSTPEGLVTHLRFRKRLWVILAFVFGIGLIIAGSQTPNPDMRASSFFGGGLLILTAGLLQFRRWLHQPNSQSLVLHPAMSELSLRNTTRSPARAILTVMLLALATFLLVAVESFRKRPDQEFLKPEGGSGGFRLLGTSDVPMFQLFDQNAGKQEWLDQLQKAYGGSDQDPRFVAAKRDLNTLALNVLPFRLHGGDDASCLNLYQARQPRILGIPKTLQEAPKRFQFASVETQTDTEKANPWLVLDQPQEDGAIPVFAEMNTILWQLKTLPGSTITLQDEAGNPFQARIIGALQDSIFQSELLMSDANFRKLYPRDEGYRVFLIDAPADQSQRVADLLQLGYRDNGLTVVSTSDRVATYQAVIGAYLSTFQLLGGLGLLIGILGLGVVILRSIWERLGELALLRAIGYQPRHLQRLCLLENLVFLLVGVALGLVSALLAIIPNSALGGQVGGLRMAAILLSVIGMGLLVTWFATRQVTRIPVIPALRKE